MDTETMARAILAAAEEWREDANNRLPYGLCKKYGIEVPPGTTPHEAWELLKKHGIDPDGAYRKTAESWERQKAAQRAAKKAAGKTAPKKPQNSPAEAREKSPGSDAEARKKAEEKARREAEEKTRREAEEKARREAEEKTRKEAEERAKREAEERSRKEAEERARKEAEERARKEAEENARKEAEERAKRESEEKAGGKTGAWPEPERLEPWKLGTAADVTAALHGRCGCPTDRTWREGVCDRAKKEIAGALVALDSRYHALDPDHNDGWPITVEDGDEPRGSIASMGEREDGTTGCLKFLHDCFGTEDAYAETKDYARKESGNGRKMPCAKGMEAAYLAAHEYGHCVQQRMMRDTGVFRPDGRWRISPEEYDDLSLAAAEKMQAEIARIAEEIEPGCEPGKTIPEGGLISRYGATDPHEFFAECFANSVCGAPNALGRAMAVFLERHIAGDGLMENYRA